MSRPVNVDTKSTPSRHQVLQQTQPMSSPVGIHDATKSFVKYLQEMDVEEPERDSAYLAYQTAAANLRMAQQENLIDKGYVSLTSEFRTFFYHDDLHNVFRYPTKKNGGMFP